MPCYNCFSNDERDFNAVLIPEYEIFVGRREGAEHIELGRTSGAEIHLAEVEGIEEDVSINVGSPT